MRLAAAIARHLVVVAVIAVGLAAVSAGLDRRIPAEAYVILLGGLALADGVSLFHRFSPPLDSTAGGGPLLWLRRQPSQPPPTPGLLEWEGLLASGVSSGRAASTRLRPRLRAFAGERLAMAAGIDLEREPGRARAFLGDEAWTLLQPLPRVPNHDEPGVPLEALAGLVERLEST